MNLSPVDVWCPSCRSAWVRTEKIKPRAACPNLDCKGHIISVKLHPRPRPLPYWNRRPLALALGSALAGSVWATLVTWWLAR